MRQVMDRVTCDLCRISRDSVAIEHATDLARKEATTKTIARKGWTTTTNGHEMIDICPACGDKPIGTPRTLEARR